MNFSRHNAGVQQDAVAPHSVTAAHRTAPALSSGAACVSQAAVYVSPAAARVSPLVARRASLALSQPRVAVPESETAEHENKTGGGRKFTFSGKMQEYSRMLLRPTPLQQPRPLQLWPRALRVATPWSLDLLDSDTLELRRQLARLQSKFFYLDYERLRMNGISEVAPMQEVCWTLWRPTTAPHRTTPAFPLLYMLRLIWPLLYMLRLI